jgi:two-component sensor histidine kinase
VSSIAVVHETLSGALDQTVEFDQVADNVAAMVLTELLQNAVEHGFAEGDSGAAPRVAISVERAESGGLRVRVRDNGHGLPAGFSVDGSQRLGLQIVRTLVETELAGRLELAAADGGGTVATVLLSPR